MVAGLYGRGGTVRRASLVRTPRGRATAPAARASGQRQQRRTRPLLSMAGSSAPTRRTSCGPDREPVTIRTARVYVPRRRARPFLLGCAGIPASVCACKGAGPRLGGSRSPVGASSWRAERLAASSSVPPAARASLGGAPQQARARSVAARASLGSVHLHGPAGAAVGAVRHRHGRPDLGVMTYPSPVATDARGGAPSRRWFRRWDRRLVAVHARELAERGVRADRSRAGRPSPRCRRCRPLALAVAPSPRVQCRRLRSHRTARLAALEGRPRRSCRAYRGRVRDEPAVTTRCERRTPSRPSVPSAATRPVLRADDRPAVRLALALERVTPARLGLDSSG
jgi:hypothetical protein